MAPEWITAIAAAFGVVVTLVTIIVKPFKKRFDRLEERFDSVDNRLSSLESKQGMALALLEEAVSPESFEFANKIVEMTRAKASGD